MPDWLTAALDGGDLKLAWPVVLTRIALAAVFGFVVAGVYALTLGRKREDARTLPTTFVLLCVLISVVTQVIGENIARAFGLVGALSIVRFRTVVEDTRDTAFVIFAVAVGMAVGAGQAALAVFAIPVMGVSAVVMGWFDKPKSAGPPGVTVVVRVGLGHDPEQLVGGAFGKHLADVRLTSTATAKQGAALELTYAARLRDPAAAVALVAELNRIDGIQGVELKQ